LRVELLSRQAEQDVIVELPVEEDVSAAPALLDEAQLPVQADGCPVCVHAGGVALLVPAFPERIAKQDPNRVLRVALAPVFSADDDPQAERPVLAMPTVEG
jgi:hypothetical protein